MKQTNKLDKLYLLYLFSIPIIPNNLKALKS